MKKVLIVIISITLSSIALSQNQPSTELPSTEMLSPKGEMQKFFELPEKGDYQVYNQKGDSIDSGSALFIEYTNYETGMYFIKQNGKTFSFSANNSNQTTKKMPPFKMLPKNGGVLKTFELPNEADYRVYNEKCDLIDLGFAEFIDCTDFEDGIYFIKFDGKLFSYSVKNLHLEED